MTEAARLPLLRFFFLTIPSGNLFLLHAPLYPVRTFGTVASSCPHPSPSFMRVNRQFRHLFLFLALYLTFCAIVDVFVADRTLHPVRRFLTSEAETSMREMSQVLDSDLENVSVITTDVITLRARTIHPHRGHNDAVILLHGLADNRLGMTAHAQLLLAHGFTVLMPDARAHGDSGCDLATYGLLERNDIHQWFDQLAGHFHPDCIFGLGESMGAAELLQSFSIEPGFCAVVAESSFSTFPEIAVRAHGPALSPRSLVRTHSLITRRRICFPESPLEIWAQPAGSFARRFSRSFRRSSSPHSWPDRWQYSASSLLPHPRAQSKYSSLESSQRRSLRSDERSFARI